MRASVVGAAVAMATVCAAVGGPAVLVAVAAMIASTAVMVALALRRWRDTRRWAWLLVGVWAVGRPADVAVLSELAPGLSRELLSWTALVFAVCGAVGLVRICFEGYSSVRRRTVLSEALVVAVSIMLVLWVVLETVVLGSTSAEAGVMASTLAMFTLQVLVLGVSLMALVHQPARRSLHWLSIALLVGSVGSAVGAYRNATGNYFGLSDLVLICLATGVAFIGFIGTASDDVVSAPRRTGGNHPVHVAIGVAFLAFGFQLLLREQISGVFGLLTLVLGASVVLNQSLSFRDSHEVLRQLEASDERFRAAFDSAPMGMVIADSDGIVVQCNPGMVEILGWPRELIEGQSSAGFVTGTAMVEHQQSQRDLREGTIQQFSQEFTIPHMDGTHRRVLVTVSRLDASGEGHTIAILQDVTEHRAARDRLEHLATHDALTGLGNRPLLETHMENALARARLDTPVAALFVDLDQFKMVNDSLGHAAGDRLLLVSAARLQDAVGDAGLVTRFGGDEFCVVLEPGPPEAHAERANVLLEVLREAVDLGGPELTYPSASVGLAIGRLGVSVEELLSEADAAMYRAKQRGRDRVECFTPADRLEARDTHRLVGEMHRGFAKGEFVVFHQPVVGVSGGRIVGTEALVRWNHPERGLQLPGTFLPLAESTGMIIELGEFVLHEACRNTAEWNRDASVTGSGATTVAVNVDVQQLSRPDFVETVRTVLLETGMDADSLWLEITETALMADVRRVERSLIVLRGMGVHLSVDDFGTGYSSLTYLKRFPVEALKIDRSFIAGLGVHTDDTEIVSALVSLGQRLGLDVVAEGVEDQHQLDTLRVLGCPLVQGYLLGRPVPAAELRNALEQQQRRDLDGVGRSPRDGTRHDDDLFGVADPGGGRREFDPSSSGRPV